MPESLQIGSDSITYLRFGYVKCVLPDLNASDYWNTHNLVARLCLSLMRWTHQEKLEVYARATRGLVELEPDPNKQLKYLDFIDIYSTLDDNDMEEFRRRYPQENTEMTTLTERLRTEGMEKGRHNGIEGMLRKQITRKFGVLPAWADERLRSATDNQLDAWVDRILDEDSLDELLGEP